MIRVYGKPSCVQCDATTRDLDKRGLEYEYRSLLDEPSDRIEAWKTEGHMSAPIVVTPTETWSGYRPDRIKNLVNQAA